VICAFSSRVPAAPEGVGRTFTVEPAGVSHTPPAGASRDPAAWTRSSFAHEDAYLVHLTPDERQMIVDAIGRLRERGRLAAPLETLTVDEFAFGALSAKFAAAYADVRSGRGFTIMRRLPLDDVLTLDEFRAVVWGIGLHFGGRLLSQNALGERITEVVDATANDPTPRMYRSNVELRLHTDITDMLSLACWYKAESGGRSTIGSGIAIHDEIARRDPHALELLYRGYHYHRLGEEADGAEVFTPYRIPVFANAGGTVSVHYQRTGIAAGHRAAGVPLTDDDIAALDLFDEVGRMPEFRLEFDLERGDMIVLNNYTIMHARGAFTNHPEPDRIRRFIRLWPAGENFRNVPKQFEHFDAPGVPPQPNKTCTFDFKTLAATDPRAVGTP
jgi:TfdA family taurine catabolism dioxygenase TauD